MIVVNTQRERTYVSTLMKMFNPEAIGFHETNWFYGDGNVALINKQGDVALFENQANLPTGTVCGHYLFRSRGAKAIEAAKEFIDEVFDKEYAHTVLGFVPVEHKGAVWITKKLGFREYGEPRDIEDAGPHRFFTMTKDRWKGTNRDE